MARRSDQPTTRRRPKKMKHLLTLTGVTPRAPERALGLIIVGLAAAMLGISASVLIWGVALLS